MTTSLVASRHHTRIVHLAFNDFFRRLFGNLTKTSTFATKCNNVVGPHAFSEPRRNWVMPLIPSAARLTPSMGILTKSWKMHPQS